MNAKLSALGLGCLLAMNMASAGIYTGATLGYQSNIQLGGDSSEWNGEVGRNTFNAFSVESEGHGVMGSLFLGYALDNLLHFGPVNGWLGLELNGELNNIDIEVRESNHIQSINVPSSYFKFTGSNRLTQHGALGVTVHPGISFTNNAKLYGIVGYEAGSFKAKSTFFSQEFVEGVPVASLADGTIIKHKNQWLNGVRYGLGASYPVTSRVDLRAEFSQTDYGRVRLSGTDASGGSLEEEFHPSSRTTSIGLVWNFDVPVAPAAYQK